MFEHASPGQINNYTIIDIKTGEYHLIYNKSQHKLLCSIYIEAGMEFEVSDLDIDANMSDDKRYCATTQDW